MSDDRDRDHDPWAPPTTQEAYAGMLWLSGGMIAISADILIAGLLAKNLERVGHDH